MLQVFFTLYRTHVPSKDYINLLYEFDITNSGHMKYIFQYIDKCDWNMARQENIVNIMTKSEHDLKGGNMYNSEEVFLKCIAEFVQVIQHFECPNKKCTGSKDSSLFQMKDIIISHPLGLSSTLSSTNVPTDCATCKCKDADSKVRYSWPDDRCPPLVSFPIAHSGNEFVTKDTVLSSSGIIGTNYELFAYTSRQVFKLCNVRMVPYFVKFVKWAELNSKPTNHQAYISYKSYTSLGHVLSL
jgi:hypothetical protein